MPGTTIQRRRGTTAQHATFTGAVGELTVDTDKKVVVVHDGATAGGIPLAKASSVPAVTPQLQPVTAGIPSAGVLLLQLNPTVMDIRSPTLGSGTVRTLTVATALTLTVPQTATLGTVSGVQSRLMLLAIDNAGTLELAVVNKAGGVNLDETTLINTTAIGTASLSASTIYSTAARTLVPFRVVGFIDSTQTVAGFWGTAPSGIQGMGGTAVAIVASATLPYLTNALTADVSLSNTAAYFDGPSIAQGTAGTWHVSGSVTLLNPSGTMDASVKLWDGATVIASAEFYRTAGAQQAMPVHLSGVAVSPTGNLRISVRDATSTSGVMKFNSSGNAADSNINAVRIA